MTAGGPPERLRVLQVRLKSGREKGLVALSQPLEVHQMEGLLRWGSEQPALVEYVPARDRELGTTRSLSSLPTQTAIWIT